MPERAEIRITELDFDNIKSNLKSYLASQDQFKDFNFDGSGMSILLDLLAYNTHYQSFYANMVANEMFLDSAILRNSVVSLAKHLAYVPRSVTAPIATVNVNWKSTNAPTQNFIPKGAVFSASAGGSSFSFVTLSNHKILQETDGSYSARGIQLYEGSLQTITFVVDANNPDQKFIIPDVNADTRTLTVRVQKSRSDTTGFSDVWEPVKNVIDLTPDSKAYYLQEIENQQYEIYFGDGVVSTAAIDGNIITVEYLSTHGESANDVGIRDSVTTPTFNYGTSTVEVVSAAGGGSDRETTDSIKYYAPLAYQAQERAVTTNDYEYVLLRDYPDIESAYIWGGEDNDPPQYGKVFISLKPKEGRYISSIEKLTIANDLLKRRNVVSITPEVVDPVYIYLSFTGNVNYDSRKTVRSALDLSNAIYERIKLFVDQDLEKFNRALYMSDFQHKIDEVDDAILSNELEVKMEYRLSPELGQLRTYEFEYGNGIFHPHDGHMPVVSSTSFVHFNGKENVPSFIDDDGNGKLRLYYFDVNNDKVYYNNDLGMVDYTTGKLVIRQFNPISIDNITEIKISATPAEQDIEIKRNIILTMDVNDLSAVSLTMNDITRPGSGGVTRVTAGRTY